MMGVIYFLLFFIGTTVFSFINVLIYRVPRGIPFGNERSICPNCGNQLKWYDLVPVLSFLFLRGKCRYCKQKISYRYPLIELLGGVLILLVFLQMDPLNYEIKSYFYRGFVTFGIFAILAAVAFVDLDTMEIPNGFVLALMVLGVLSIPCFCEITMVERVIGIFSVSVPMLVLTLMIPGAFGGGDMKLMAALGIFLGWKLSLLTFLFAILTGGAYGIYLLLTKKKGKKDHFAFGPFLCVGVVLAFFWGNQLLTWYLGLIP